MTFNTRLRRQELLHHPATLLCKLLEMLNPVHLTRMWATLKNEQFWGFSMPIALYQTIPLQYP